MTFQPSHVVFVGWLFGIFLDGRHEFCIMDYRLCIATWCVDCRPMTHRWLLSLVGVFVTFRHDCVVLTWLTIATISFQIVSDKVFSQYETIAGAVSCVQQGKVMLLQSICFQRITPFYFP